MQPAKPEWVCQWLCTIRFFACTGDACSAGKAIRVTAMPMMTFFFAITIFLSPLVHHRIHWHAPRTGSAAYRGFPAGRRWQGNPARAFAFPCHHDRIWIFKAGARFSQYRCAALILLIYRTLGFGLL
jgi:hypothetical protein